MIFFYYRNSARWSQKQDQVNKEFFNKFKRKYRPLSITCSKRPDGSYTISDDSEMQCIVSDYYNPLLSTKTFTTNSLYKKQVILTIVQ